ncbi:hypothetical protein ACT7DP_02905 [Bacillus paranthracis]
MIVRHPVTKREAKWWQDTGYGGREEIAYLEHYWGIYSIKHMAKKFGRSVDAVKLKAQRIGLGDARLHFEGITILQLSEVIGVDYNCIKKLGQALRFSYKAKVIFSGAKSESCILSGFMEVVKKHINM